MNINAQEKERIVRFASMLIGKKYRLGAEVISDDLRVNRKLKDITEIDCSELVEYVFWNALHVKVRDGSFNQFEQVDILCAEADATKCRVVGEAGDLVFRRLVAEPKTICHVGVYVGDGKVVEAFSTDKGVITRTIESFVIPSQRTLFAGLGRLNLAKTYNGV